MTKSELNWVIARLAGTFLVAAALWSALGLGSNLLGIASFPNTGMNAAPILIDGIIRISVLTIAGLYFLKDGSLLFDLLDR